MSQFFAAGLPEPMIAGSEDPLPMYVMLVCCTDGSAARLAGRWFLCVSGVLLAHERQKGIDPPESLLRNHGQADDRGEEQGGCGDCLATHAHFTGLRARGSGPVISIGSPRCRLANRRPSTSATSWADW